MIKAIIIGIVITIVSLFSLAAVQKITSGNSSSNSVNGYATSEVVNANRVNVSISGEINHSGTYALSPEDVLGSLIAMAGGVTEKADVKAYNESLVISTHVAFYIPPVSETPSLCVDTTITKVNINGGSEEALISVGFNNAQASALVTYRKENGDFQAIEDILKVKGIGEATFNRVKNKICLA